MVVPSSKNGGYHHPTSNNEASSNSRGLHHTAMGYSGIYLPTSMYRKLKFTERQEKNEHFTQHYV